MKRGWLILLGAWLCWTTGLAATGDVGRVVAVKLRNGTQLEGTVVGEDDQQLSLLVEQAGGSITQTRIVPKSDIESVQPVSDAELARRAMLRAYENTRRFQLQAAASYPEAYYRQVIANVFQPFLERYPDSPYATDIAAKIRQWQAERDQVAAGRVKYEGRWMPVADAARRYEERHGKQALESARVLYRQKQYAKAVDLVRPLSVPEARELESAAYQAWLAALQQEQQRLTATLPRAQQRLAAAEQEFTRRQSTAVVPKLGEVTENGKLGEGGTEVLALNRARSEFLTASNQVAEAEVRLAELTRSIVEVTALARAAGVKAAAARAAAPAQPAPAGSPEESPEILSSTQNFFQKHWLYIVVVLLVAIWGVTRYFAR